MRTLFRRLASLRLTVGLLLVLGALSAAGSAVPQGLPAAEYEQFRRWVEAADLILRQRISLGGRR